MKRFCLAILTVLSSWGTSADVTVTNLVVAQRPGTKLMEITYDVSSSTTNAVTISLTVSNGTTAVTATNLTGSVGTGILTGPGKAIIWNMGTDWKTNAATLSFSVWAHDGTADALVSKTGQTASYRTGDDGDLEMGVAWPNPRFTDLVDGTVVDNLTGLEWVKEPHALSGNFGATNWNSAIDFCNNLVYAGHSDWRLPNIKELWSLIDCGRYNPSLPTNYPFLGLQTDGWYWAGTSRASNTGYAWYIHINDGYISYGFSPFGAKAYNFYTWPVRRGSAINGAAVPKTGQTASYRTGDDGDLEMGVAWPNPRFTDLVDGTVVDNLTGLEWVKEPHALSGNFGATNWNSAIDFCNNLVYAGHSDWRLPNIKELWSLIDCGRYNPSLPTNYPFLGLYGTNGTYWASTTYSSSTDTALAVDISSGSFSGGNGTYKFYVWPVHGNP